MKLNIKALLIGAALILGMQGAAHAVSPDTVAKLTQKFEFFNQLPKEVQAQIVGLLYANYFEDSMKQLSKLRLVSKQMRDLIDNEYTGKQIITMIAQGYREIDPLTITRVALEQNLPSSWAWLKEQAATNPQIRKDLTSRIEGILTSHQRMEGNPLRFRPLNQQELQQIKKLLIAGADAQIKMNDDWTLLTVAASLGDLEAVQLILNAGADINHIVPKKEGMENSGTALDLAIKNQGSASNNKELIELLKSNGAKTAAELDKK
jgi:hypothetical protein